MLVTLARHPAAGLEHEFALCFEGRLSDELTNSNATVHQLGEVRFRKPWTLLRARRQLREVLSTAKFDVVVCHAPWSRAIFAPVAVCEQVTLVYWEHDIASTNHWLRLFARSCPNLILANSRFTESTIRFASCQVEVIAYPVAAPAITEGRDSPAITREEFGASPEDVVIIQACRLAPWKGHELLLDGLAQMRDLPSWKAWIVGGPQQYSECAYFAKLKERVSGFGLDSHVKFLGQRSDIPRLLSAADIHCQPNSMPEPFGIAFIEALYAGLPVVTTDFGGAAELIDESCGILIPTNSPSQLTEALRKLVSDSKARLLLGSAGPQRAKKLCDPDTVQHRIRKLFEQCLAPDSLVAQT